VPTPVLLVDGFFSGVRIGERRWNVLREGSDWRNGSIVRTPFSVKSIFELFLRFAAALLHVYALFSPVLAGSRVSERHTFRDYLYLSLMHAIQLVVYWRFQIFHARVLSPPPHLVFWHPALHGATSTANWKQ
jgi:hypothetical protein